VSKSIAPVPDPPCAPPGVARSRVVIPSPAQPGLQLVLTCEGTACGQTFEPDPVVFTGGRLSCPRCGGWAFVGDLVEPSAAGGAS
jgi:hypothetical protein